MCAKKCKTGKCGKGKCEKASPTTTATQTVKARIALPPSVAAASAGVAVQAAGRTQPPETTISIEDPALAIRDYGAEFHKLYSQYSELRELAKPLNGLPQDRKLPDGVTVSKIVIEFSVGDVAHTAEIPGATMIVEVSALIGNGLRTLIDKMYQTLFTLDHVTKNMQSAVQNAVAAKQNSEPSLRSQGNEKAV
jgi:hypothetical protein